MHNLGTIQRLYHGAWIRLPPLSLMLTLLSIRIFRGAMEEIMMGPRLGRANAPSIHVTNQNSRVPTIYLLLHPLKIFILKLTSYLSTNTWWRFAKFLSNGVILIIETP